MDDPIRCRRVGVFNASSPNIEYSPAHITLTDGRLYMLGEMGSVLGIMTIRFLLAAFMSAVLRSMNMGSGREAILVQFIPVLHQPQCPTYI